MYQARSRSREQHVDTGPSYGQSAAESLIPARSHLSLPPLLLINSSQCALRLSASNGTHLNMPNMPPDFCLDGAVLASCSSSLSSSASMSWILPAMAPTICGMG